MSLIQNDENFISKRMAVAIAILILYLLHYTTLFLSSCFNYKYQGEYTSRRIFLYGISVQYRVIYFQLYQLGQH
ncbi:unnamed protein product [Paramecium primaurelia]|uniref:Uncharacterized protein n=1 Tax=Paramecium primaurelia TaxID=5886 RepID=A0A8S1QGR0_PARPR|nr:unnamed protein product [Paramecium primaurelia]